ncbi:uncharacterized protein TrAtP1_002492 [Trichoderma atroviride]|uniref:uncharacterized protein n=1 Tax=Hypocrea atroviridis TaxID=63577 RepID=UPI003331C6DA|nr:hypothetical protein TrAtP1_002492 [Trichoderma atroviride]
MDDGQRIDVGAIVQKEGLDSFQVVEDDDLGEAIVLDEELLGEELLDKELVGDGN